MKFIIPIDLFFPAVAASNVATGALCFHITLRHCSMVLQVLSFAQLIVKLLEMVVDNIFSFSLSQGARKGNFSKVSSVANFVNKRGVTKTEFI